MPDDKPIAPTVTFPKSDYLEDPIPPPNPSPGTYYYEMNRLKKLNDKFKPIRDKDNFNASDWNNKCFRLFCFKNGDPIFFGNMSFNNISCNNIFSNKVMDINKGDFDGHMLINALSLKQYLYGTARHSDNNNGIFDKFVKKFLKPYIKKYYYSKSDIDSKISDFKKIIDDDGAKIANQAGLINNAFTRITTLENRLNSFADGEKLTF